MSSALKNILIIRNDKLGDFMLAYPAFCLLKKSLPDCTITALVPAYTQAAAEICPWLDDVIVQGENKTLSQHRALAEELKACQFDAVIILFSNFSNAITTWLSRIPYRLAPATKWVQIFYNNRLLQR